MATDTPQPPSLGKRWLKRTSYLLLGLCGLLALFWLALHSGPGRRWSAAQLSRTLSSEALTIEISPWAGRLPTSLTLPLIKVSQSNEPMIELTGLHIEPDLSSLLSDQPAVQSLRIETVYMTPIDGASETKEEPTPSANSTPLSIPAFAVRHLSIGSFELNTGSTQSVIRAGLDGSVIINTNQTGIATLVITPTLRSISPISTHLSFSTLTGFNATGSLSCNSAESAAGHSLTNIDANVSLTSHEGRHTLTTTASAYADAAPVSIKGQVDLNSEQIRISDLRVTAENTTCFADLTINPSNHLVRGTTTFTIKAPSLLSSLISTNLAGISSGSLQFTVDDSNQKLVVQTDLSATRWANWSLDSLSLTGQVTRTPEQSWLQPTLSLYAAVNKAGNESHQVQQFNLALNGTPDDFLADLSVNNHTATPYMGTGSVRVVRNAPSWEFSVIKLGGSVDTQSFALQAPTRLVLTTNIIALNTCDLRVGNLDLRASGEWRDNAFRHARLSITNLNLAALPGLKLPQLAGKLSANAMLDGTLGNPEITLSLSGQSIRLPLPSGKQTPPLAIDLSSSLHDNAFSLNANVSHLTPWANLRVKAPLAVNLTTLSVAFQTNAPLSGDLSYTLPLEQLPFLASDLGGSLTGHVALAGTTDDPTIDASLATHELTLRTDDQKQDIVGRSHAQAHYARGVFTITNNIDWGDMGSFNVYASAPIHYRPAPLSLAFNTNQSLKANATCDVNLALLNNIPTLAAQSITGRLKGRVVAVRTGTNLSMNGQVNLVDGGYEHFIWKTRLKDVEAELRLEHETLILDHIKATDAGKGRVSGTGRIALREKKAEATLELETFKIVGTEAINLTSSGKLALLIDPKTLSLKGIVGVDEGTCNLAELRFGPKTLEFSDRDSESPATTPTNTPSRNLEADLTFNLNKNVKVHSRILDSSWDGSVHYRARNGKQGLDGDMNVWNGRLNLLGIWFDLNESKVSFTDTWPPSPNLDLNAFTQRYGIEATATLTGNISDPTLELTSDPHMHQDEIISHLLFGKSVSEISSTQVLQLASRIRQLKNPSKRISTTDRATKLLDVDYIDVREGSDDSEIAIGKQLTDKLRTEIRRPISSSASGGAVHLEYELRPHVTVETDIGNEENSYIGINWKLDY